LATKTSQAKRYSQAVFELAKENNEIDRWKSDLQIIAQLARNSDFASVMQNPKYHYAEKTRLLRGQLTSINKMSLNLVDLLTSKGMFSLIVDIYTEYELLVNKSQNIEKAEVVTAAPLSEEDKLKIAEHFGGVTGNKIILSEKVDPSIIGGLVVKVGGKLIDGSTRSQLLALRNELQGSVKL
jgi:F-type H+-transporting ATPase subunit delta